MTADAVAIGDSGDPRLGDYLGIRLPASLAERGLFVAESRHVVRRLLEGGRFRIRSLWATPRSVAALRPEIEAYPAPFEIYTSSRELFSEVAGYSVHHGCLAIADRGSPADPIEIARGGRLLLGLERLANPDNVGGVFRNAQAFGADGIWFAPGGADPFYRKVLRVSTGAALAVPFAHAADWPTDLGRLRAEGYTILAAVSGGSDAIDVRDYGRDRDRPERVCLLFGAEDEGLSPAARAASDACVTVRMASGFDSLNVATASGILLHHFSE